MFCSLQTCFAVQNYRIKTKYGNNSLINLYFIFVKKQARYLRFLLFPPLRLFADELSFFFGLLPFCTSPFLLTVTIGSPFSSTAASCRGWHVPPER